MHMPTVIYPAAPGRDAGEGNGFLRIVNNFPQGTMCLQGFDFQYRTQGEIGGGWEAGVVGLRQPRSLAVGAERAC